MSALVILDRDGVINADSPDYIKSPEEWHALPGSLEAIAALHRAGFIVVVASNQSGLGRGLFDAAALEAIHEKMLGLVNQAGGHIDRIFFCPHHPDAGCDCRKPLPGLLQQIARTYGQSLAGVPVIGDSGRDLEAARAMGARPILVLTGNGERTLSADPAPEEAYPDLAATARVLIEERAQ